MLTERIVMVDTVHQSIVVEHHDDELVSFVVRLTGRPDRPRKRRIVARFEGETAWSDAERRGYDEALVVRHG